MKRKPLPARLQELVEKHQPDKSFAIHDLNTLFKYLPTVKRAIGGNGKIYANVHYISRSGMTRTISLYVVHQGEIVNLNHTFFKYIYGDRFSPNRVAMCGCGMDMLFEATYRLYQFLFDQKRRPYQKHLNRYQRI